MNLALRAVGLGFGYAADTRLFTDLDFEIPFGRVVGLTGRSGSGKSTLLYLLGLMLDPRAGHIEVDGIDTGALSDIGRSRLRAQYFGFVFQDAALDQRRSVLDNVLEPCLYRGESRKDARAGAIDLLEGLEVDLPLDRRPGKVSGGQAARIALCRALLTDPRIILADEPTGNLDRATAEVVVGVLMERARSGATVVIASHDPNVVGVCDDVIQLTP